MLKDNTLIYNYKTQATDGDFDCNYTIPGNTTLHDQIVCFDYKFDVKDIKTVWVSFDSGKFFELFFYQK